MYVIIVDFEIKPDHLAAFLPLMAENAAASVREEPGCRQFDVCQDPDTPHRIFLYEIYDDRAAFEAHLESAHFRRFDVATMEMVTAKAVRALTRL
jgi:quinol monooxygenase YgiN